MHSSRNPGLASELSREPPREYTPRRACWHSGSGTDSTLPRSFRSLLSNSSRTSPPSVEFLSSHTISHSLLFAIETSLCQVLGWCPGSERYQWCQQVPLWRDGRNREST